LGKGKAADHARDRHEVRRAPAVEPGERRGGTGRERLDCDSGEREPEQRCDDRRGECVRRDGEQLQRVELEPRNRRGRDAARCGDGDDDAQGPAEGISLEEDR
jgi:hypothetical protein